MSDTLTWVGPNSADPSGDWNVASNWDGDMVPTITQTALLLTLPDPYAETDAGVIPYTVTIGSGAQDAVDFLYLDPVLPAAADPLAAAIITLAINGGSLEVNEGLQAHGAIVLSQGGTLMIDQGHYDPGTIGGFVLRFGDGAANVLNLQNVGGLEDQDYGLAPDNFIAPIVGFSGGDIIATNTSQNFSQGQSITNAGDTLSYVGDSTGGVLTLTGLGVPSRFAPAQLEPLADLLFIGGYTAGNFRIVTYDGTTAIEFQLNEIDASANHALVQGTIGDDLFKVSGSFDTIIGNGGNDTIRTTGGYDRIVVGAPHDGVGGPPDAANVHTLVETIALGGRGNTVTVGDESVVLTAMAGYDTITLGGGASTLTIGPYTTLTAGRGDYTITALGGNETLTFDDDLVSGGPAIVALTLTGMKNVVNLGFGPNFDAPFTLTSTGGDGSGVFDVAAGQVDITTGGTYNRFDLGSVGSNTITTGSGHASVTLEQHYNSGANDTITLGGSNNVVQGYANSLAVTGGTGSNSFVLDQGGDAPATVGIVADGLYNSFQLSNANNNTITAGSGYDRVTIGAPVGSPAIDKSIGTPPQSDVTLSGPGNAVSSTGENLTVAGGSGLGTFDITGGYSSITTGGDNNHFVIDGSVGTITASGSNNTFVLSGQNDTEISLSGSNNMVFLGSGGSVGIDGTTSNLRLSISPGTGNDSFLNFGSDPGTFIHLLGGVGGYTTPQQVVAALIPIGPSDAYLPLGSGYLDFGVPIGSIKASSFGIG